MHCKLTFDLTGQELGRNVVSTLNCKTAGHLKLMSCASDTAYNSPTMQRRKQQGKQGRRPLACRQSKISNGVRGKRSQRRIPPPQPAVHFHRVIASDLIDERRLQCSAACISVYRSSAPRLLILTSSTSNTRADCGQEYVNQSTTHDKK